MILLWASVSEFLLAGGLFCTFFAAPMRTGIVWMQLVHFARAVFGVLFITKIPRVRDWINKLNFDES